MKDSFLINDMEQNPMNKAQKKNLLLLALIGIIYFGIFILPNLAGSKDLIMLSVFEQDEFAEYPFVLRMLTSDLSLYQTIRYFVIYLFYYYGYPFFFFSALWLLPIKWILGPEWTTHTQLIVLVLRQLVNVLPGILSVGFLVYLQTRLISRWKSIALFLGLLIFPPLVVNNIWWHPDGLLLLFSVLTLFFLDRDHYSLKKNFYFAAITVGLAISTKIIGLFFFLAIFVYLVYSFWQTRVPLRKIVLSGLLFILVMVASLLVSNPVLLLPIERAEVLTAYSSGFSQLTSGFYEKSTGLIKWMDSWPNLRKYYGQLFFILFTLFAAVYGILKDKNRTVNLLILCWGTVHFIYFAFFVTVMKDYYLLPSALPLVSSLGTLLCFLPERLKDSWKEVFVSKKQGIFLSLAAVIVIIQFALFIRTSSSTVLYAISKENRSESIRFFTNLDRNYLSKIPTNQNIIIYRDWRAYVREQPNWTIEMEWKFASYAYIQELKPDVLILEFDNIHYFSQESVLQNSLDQSLGVPRFEFYSDAFKESIDGYQLVYKDDFAYAFVSNELFSLYLK